MRLTVPTLTPRKRATHRSAPPPRSAVRVGRWLFGEVRIPRQTLFVRERMDALKKALQAFEIRVAFSRDKRFAMAGARVTPSLRDRRGILRHVFDGQHDEPSLTQHAFVHAWWHQNIEADRTSNRDLLVRDDPGDNHRVREQHAAART